MEVIGIILAVAFASCLLFGFRSGNMPIKAPLREPSRHETPLYFWSLLRSTGLASS